MPPTQTKRRRVVAAATQSVDGREVPHASTQQPAASASNGVAAPVRNLPATQPATPAGAARPLLLVKTEPREPQPPVQPTIQVKPEPLDDQPPPTQQPATPLARAQASASQQPSTSQEPNSRKRKAPSQRAAALAAAEERIKRLEEEQNELRRRNERNETTIADLQQLKDRVTAENAQLKQSNERTLSEVVDLKRRLSMVEGPVRTQLDSVETYSNAATIIDFEGERVSGDRERTPSIDLSFQSEDANADTTAVEAGAAAGPVADKIGMFFASGADGNYAYSLNDYWQFEHFMLNNPPIVFYFDYEHFKVDLFIEDWERNENCPVLLLRVADIAAWEAKPPLPLTDCVRYKRRMPAGQVGGQPVECQLILFVKNGVNESNEFAVEAFHSEAAFWPLVYALTSVQPADTCGGDARGTKTLLMCRGLDCETLTLYAAEDASRIKLTV
ncbi:hypothetical protein M3Y99_00986000 [Aphelenchoides fujianensis]|nr:hypothetical protein M3Y99_00986000 [Aphelenchoides fujianensis]